MAGIMQHINDSVLIGINSNISTVNIHNAIDDDNNYYNFNNNTSDDHAAVINGDDPGPNWWALIALGVVVATVAGNVLVCLAIYWEKRLQNVTNYFLTSLAITDLMVAILVMPMGILTLVRGYFPLAPVYCLAWICLDVLFCTASIMHLCAISVDRYLSLRYPMSFGRNKTRRRVTLKICFVWIMSVALSLPLSLMYSQIPNPVYRVIGSIVSFYIPLVVMLVTYATTVRLLDVQRRNLSTDKKTIGFIAIPTSSGSNNRPQRQSSWRRLRIRGYQEIGKHNDRKSHSPSAQTMLLPPKRMPVSATKSLPPSTDSTPLRIPQQLQTESSSPLQHGHSSSAVSNETDLSTLDMQDLWLPDYEPTPSTLSALHQFGKEMLRLSSGLQNVNLSLCDISPTQSLDGDSKWSSYCRTTILQEEPVIGEDQENNKLIGKGMILERRSSSFHGSSTSYDDNNNNCSTHQKGQPQLKFKRWLSFGGWDKSWNQSNDSDEVLHQQQHSPVGKSSATIAKLSRASSDNSSTTAQLKIQSSNLTTPIHQKIKETGKTQSQERQVIQKAAEGFSTAPVPVVVDYNSKSGEIMSRLFEPQHRSHASSMVAKKRASLQLLDETRIQMPSRCCSKKPFSQILERRSFKRPTPTKPKAELEQVDRRNSSLMIRNSSKHGRIIRLEQKATKVLGIVFFTFVILWAPFFILNLVLAICIECEQLIHKGVFDLVTWLGYASSMVNPIFYTTFNKMFREAFIKVLKCKYYRNNTKKNATGRLFRTS